VQDSAVLRFKKLIPQSAPIPGSIFFQRGIAFHEVTNPSLLFLARILVQADQVRFPTQLI
jgi:hypothetical protein